MPYFKVNARISIFYLDEGPKDTDKPAALLVPGLTCDLHDWSWQVPYLLDLGLRVISFDPRGQGKSSNPLPTRGIMSWPGADAFRAHHGRIIDYYPQTTAHDAAALLDHLGVAQVVAVSHSLGSLATYYLAAELRPGMVRAIVALDPVLRFTSAERDARRDFFEEPNRVVEKIVASIRSIHSSPMPAWQAAWFRRRAMEMDPEVLWAQCWGGWGDRAALGRRENAVEAFAGRLRCPRLVFASDEIGAAAGRDVLPRGSDMDEVVLVDGVGHWFHQVRDKEVNAKLGEWLGRLGILGTLNGEKKRADAEIGLETEEQAWDVVTA